MAFLDRIDECNRFDLSRYVRFVVDREPVGFVRRDRCAWLEAWPEFEHGDDRVSLELGPDRATELLAEVVGELAAADRGPPLHGELYPVAKHYRAPRRAVLDRSYVAWFGVPSQGVHVNGFVRDHEGLRMWVAVRSAGKITFPGMLDNMVAGGLPIDVEPDANVQKECAEEAGLPDALSRTARPVSAVSYCVEHERGLKPDTMFCYDLELPADFVPRPVDGEVERFELWPIDRVARRVRDTADFKFNCNLVILDFLMRHGELTPADPDYLAIASGLRRGRFGVTS